MLASPTSESITVSRAPTALPTTLALTEGALETDRLLGCNTGVRIPARDEGRREGGHDDNACLIVVEEMERTRL